MSHILKVREIKGVKEIQDCRKENLINNKANIGNKVEETKVWKLVTEDQGIMVDLGNTMRLMVTMSAKLINIDSEISPYLILLITK